MSDDKREDTTDTPRLSQDALFAKALQEIRDRAAAAERQRLRKIRTFSLFDAADITGLGVAEIEWMARNDAINMTEVCPDRWEIPRDEVLGLIRRQAADQRTQAGSEYLSAFDDWACPGGGWV